MKILAPFLVLIIVIFFVGCFFAGVPQVFAVQPPSVTSISPSFGPTAGGTSVTIAGTDFASGTVTIGGASATNVTVVSATQITATTPAGTAGARDVVFTRTPDGKSGTLTGGFTYVVPHTITASAGAHGSISPSGAVLVIDGASQSFFITPDANYHVADVLVDSVSVGAVTSYNFTNVIANHTIAATFAEGEGEPSIPPSIPSEPGSSAGRIVSVIFSGQAYPGSKIEVLRRGSLDENAPYLTIPLETYKVSDDGTFDLSLGVLASDEYFFALRVEDKDGRKTGIIAFDVDLKTTDTLEAKNIFIPPTVELEKTVTARGKEVNIFGYAGPHNLIEIEIDGFIAQTAKAGEDGYWTAAINTSALTPREHAVKVRQIDRSGQESRFSLARSFRISLLKSPEVDFNGDGVINITDWSVFLFRWGQDDENVRLTIDLNKDGKINISDFSMFLNMMKLQ